MLHCDLALATRLEKAAAGMGRDAVDAHRRLFEASNASYIDCAGGIASFLDEASPLTQIRGAGMISPTVEADLDAVEAFYEERMAPVSFVLSPFADAALFTYLSRRGYELGSFEHTLVREVTQHDADPDIVETSDDDEWSHAMAEAFFDVVTPSGVDLARTIFNVPTCKNVIVRANQTPAAAAQIDIRDGLATLQCDGTISSYREAGLQKKLINARLHLAHAAGCDIATADVQPGSLSHRNYEKCGFQIAYTKVTLIKPCF